MDEEEVSDEEEERSENTPLSFIGCLTCDDGEEGNEGNSTRLALALPCSAKEEGECFVLLDLMLSLSTGCE